MTLPAYTWDQATILGLATARGFQALGLNAATIRKWASRGHITPAGKAPGGAHLYPIRDVTGHADHHTHSAPATDVSHLGCSGRGMSA